MSKRHKLFYHFIAQLISITVVITFFEPILPATPLDNFLSHPFVDEILRQLPSQPTMINNSELWDYLKETDFIKQNTQKLTQQFKANMQAIDPVVFATALQKLITKLNVPVANINNLDAILTALITHGGLEPLDAHKNYLILNFISTMSDFLTTQAKECALDYTALTEQLEQSFAQTIQNIKDPLAEKKTPNKKKSFFKKRYLVLLLLLVSITIGISIAIGLKIKQRHKQAEMEKTRQHEEEIEKIRQAIDAQYGQKLTATKTEVENYLSTIQKAMEELSHNLESTQGTNTKQIDELASDIDDLDKGFKLLVEDYHTTKEATEKQVDKQQKNFDRTIKFTKELFDKITRKYSSDMSDMGKRIDEVTRLNEEVERKKTWIDSALEGVGLDDASKLLDVADRGLGTISAAYSFVEKLFGKKNDAPSLQERLEKLRENAPDFSVKIPTVTPKLSAFE